jgi:hypothetical protein
MGAAIKRNEKRLNVKSENDEIAAAALKKAAAMAKMAAWRRHGKTNGDERLRRRHAAAAT